MIPRSREQLLELLREKLSTCVKCGACHAFCPVFRERRHEGAGMRGKLALLQAWVAGREFPPNELLAAIEGNLDCFACRAACANAVDIPVILPIAQLLLDSDAWERWSALGKPASGSEPVTDSKERDGCALPEAGLKTTVPGRPSGKKQRDPSDSGKIGRCSKLTDEGHDEIVIASEAKQSGRLKQTKQIASAASPSRNDGRTRVVVNQRATTSKEEASSDSPRPADASATDSTSVGRQTPFPDMLLIVGPDGEPAALTLKTFLDNRGAGSGTVKLLVADAPCRFPFEPLVLDSWGRHLLATLADGSFATIVVADPVWLFQARLLGNLYFLSDDERSLLGRMVDLGAFLCERAFDAVSVREGTWTWHDPCFAARVLGIKSQPRKLLSRLTRQPPVETAVEGACCGGKGRFEPELAPIADRLLGQRVTQLARSGITGVVTSCDICAGRLKKPLGERGIACRTLIDFVAECLR